MRKIKFFNLFIFAFLFLYLFVVQVVDPFNFAKYKTMRETPYKKTIVAARGNFYDRNLRTIATISKYYQIDIDRNLLKIYSKKKNLELEDVYLKVSKMLKKYTNRDIYSLLTKDNSLSSVHIGNNIVDTDVKKIKDDFKKTSIPLPIISYNSMKRVYPMGGILQTVLGKTQNFNNVSFDSRSITQSLKGMDGLEKFFENKLKGENGWYKFYKNGTPYIQENNKKKAIDGYDIVLSVDVEVQKILENVLEKDILKYNAKIGIGLIMNPNTGEILASHGIKKSADKKLETFRNYPISHLYSPGSSIKPFFVQLALEKKILNENSKIDCSPFDVGYGNRVIVDHSSSRVTDSLNLEQILQYSSNVGAMKIAQKIGKDDVYNRLNDLGFGHFLLTDMYGEEKGILKQIDKWTDFSLHSLAIGHEIAVTPIQMATAYCSIANGGYLLRPFIVKKIFSNDKEIETKGKKIIAKISTKKTITLVKNMLRKVVDDGTAIQTKIDNFLIAGKTGTAEEIGRSTKNNLVHSSSFCGFFPVENPDYLILVVFEDAKGVYHFASKSAVPTFKKIVQEMILNPNISIDYGNNSCIMPSLIGLDKKKSEAIMNNLGIKYEFFNSSQKRSLVLNQFPKANVIFDKSVTANIYFGIDKSKKNTQSFIGLTIREVFSLLGDSIQIRISGKGIIYEQAIIDSIYTLKAK